MRSRQASIFVCAVVLVALLASCGGNGGSAAIREGGGSVTVDDFEDRPDSAVLWNDLSDAEKNAVRSLDIVQRPRSRAKAAASLPAEFDARVQWPGLITPPLEQGHCGNCYAFSTTTAISDRIRIASSGTELANTVIFKFNGLATPDASCSFPLAPGGSYAPDGLSMYQLTDCGAESGLEYQGYDYSSDGCAGSLLHKAYMYAKLNGLVKLTAYPQQPAEHRSPSPHPCATTAADDRIYRVENIVQITDLDSGSTQAEIDAACLAIQQELYANGPVSVGFYVPETFRSFFRSNPTGVFTGDCPDSGCGGHDVVIIGWGTQDGTPYWLVRNSWGPSFGDCGYFRIQRGVNLAGIEHSAWAATGYTVTE